jgi:HEAT repeats
MGSARKKEPAMRRPPARSILCGIVLVVVTAAAPGAMAFAASADLPGRVLEVAVKSGRLSLRAYQARLADVLEAIGRQAGVRIVLHGDLDAPVTETFANLAVDQGIRRLSRWHSVVLIYAPSSGRADSPVLTEAWLAGFSGDSGEARRPVDHRTVPVDHRTVDETNALKRISAAIQALVREEGDSEIVRALNNGRPVAREHAVQALVREHGVSNTVEVLREFAIGDPSPLVRRAALRALMSGQNMYGVEELREVATRDPAPLVRREAIRALGSMKNPEAGDALQATLGDPDPAVRSAAKWNFEQWQSRAR